jgi:hypothetical protein
MRFNFQISGARIEPERGVKDILGGADHVRMDESVGPFETPSALLSHSALGSREPDFVSENFSTARRNPTYS